VAHPAPYSMDTGCSFLLIKRLGCDVDHLPPSNAEVRNGWCSTNISRACQQALVKVSFNFFRRIRKISRIDCYVRQVCLSVRPSFCPREQIGSHWTDFREICCLIIFVKSVEKLQYSLQKKKNKGTLHKELCNLW
jgi:hypothetical protein